MKFSDKRAELKHGEQSISEKKPTYIYCIT